VVGKPQQRALEEFLAEHGIHAGVDSWNLPTLTVGPAKDGEPRGWEAILAQVADGKSITAIAAAYRGKIPGCSPDFPSRSFLAHLLNDNPERRELLREAKKEAAEAYADRADHIVETVRADRDEVSKARFQAEHWRWRAQVHDREQFGERPTVQINQNTSIAHLHLQALLKPAAPRVAEANVAKSLPSGTEESDAEG